LALLAQAQFWRTEVVTVDAAGLKRWITLVRRAQLPGTAVAGPWYVIGRAYVQQKRYDEAALALMRIPILYPGEDHLASEALLLAARSLHRGGHPLEARQLVREILTDHAAREVRREAEQLMEQLDREGT
jgi:tetratricopeptide (TPR) repeat protein